jgi:hypothetical protein
MATRISVKLAVAGLSVLAALQFVRPGIPSGPAVAEIQVPPRVLQILQKDCYSCHSNERRLAWFDEITPAYLLVRHDILAARERLNFSTLGSKPVAAQRAALYEAVNMIQLGAMPLPKFIALHPDAKVTPEESMELKAYLAPWNLADGGGPGPNPNAAEAAVNASLESVPAEFNGLPFDPGFETWKPLSFTDRGDNNTLRMILGNEIAIKAAETGNISPWPDGARFAKVAWQQERGDDGLVYPGKFVQVEFMVKQTTQYRDTDGWGWGRWRGLNLKPYGTDSHFVAECTGCHQPVRGDDFVYTLPITTGRSGLRETINNRAAALPQNLRFQPLQWYAITMFVDPKTRTMSTLFGNDVAMRAVRVQGGKFGKPPAYSSGSVLALLTWAQREDPHWFGGRIPDRPESVEFAEIDSFSRIRAYRRFDGSMLKGRAVSTEEVSTRSSFLLSLIPATLPSDSN